MGRSTHPAKYAKTLNQAHMFSRCPKATLREGYKTYCMLSNQQQGCIADNQHVRSLALALTEMRSVDEIMFTKPSYTAITARAFRKWRQIHENQAEVVGSDSLVDPGSPLTTFDCKMGLSRDTTCPVLMSEYLSVINRPVFVSQIRRLRIQSFNPEEQPIFHFVNAFGSLPDLRASM